MPAPEDSERLKFHLLEVARRLDEISNLLSMTAPLSDNDLDNLSSALTDSALVLSDIKRLRRFEHRTGL